MGDPQQSKRYHKTKNSVLLFGFGLDLLILLIFFFSGLSLQLKNITAQYASNALLANGLYILIFSLGMYLLHFPLSVFSEFKLEHAYKLSNQSFRAWLKDDLKRTLLSFVVFLIFVEVIYIFLGAFPQRWWVGAGLFWVFVSFVLAKLTPNVIVPLFFKYQPVRSEALKQKIFGLFGSCRVGLKDIYTIDLSAKTKKANAFLCGLGRNRRVVLSDTLLSNFNEEEIEAVVAHELGHYKHHDIFKLLLVNSVVIFIGFYLVHLFFQYALQAYSLSGLEDISFLPMVLVSLLLFGVITAPILNGYSRIVEREADRFSLEQTKKPAVFISMIRKLGEMNLAEFEPNRWVEWFLHDHPPIGKRIAFAETFNKH